MSESNKRAQELMNDAVMELHQKLEAEGFDDPVLYLAFHFSGTERNTTLSLTNGDVPSLAAIAVAVCGRLMQIAEEDGFEFPEKTKKELEALSATFGGELH